MNNKEKNICLDLSEITELKSQKLKGINIEYCSDDPHQVYNVHWVAKLETKILEELGNIVDNLEVNC